MKIILNDKTELKNLTLNGNNFISETEITKEMFKDNLQEVIIDGENHHDMKLIQISEQNENEWWFILAEKTADEKKDELYLKEFKKQTNHLVALESENIKLKSRLSKMENTDMMKTAFIKLPSSKGEIK